MKINLFQSQFVLETHISLLWKDSASFRLHQSEFTQLSSIIFRDVIILMCSCFLFSASTVNPELNIKRFSCSFSSSSRFQHHHEESTRESRCHQCRACSEKWSSYLKNTLKTEWNFAGRGRMNSRGLEQSCFLFRLRESWSSLFGPSAATQRTATDRWTISSSNSSAAAQCFSWMITGTLKCCSCSQESPHIRSDDKRISADRRERVSIKNHRVIETGGNVDSAGFILIKAFWLKDLELAFLFYRRSK